MEVALRSLLIGDAGVSALVGSRVVWIERPQSGSLPAVVLTRVSGGHDYHHGGRVDLSMARVQADCFAATYGEAVAVGSAVMSALSGHAGNDFKGIFVESRRDLREEGGPEKIFRVSIDFMVHHAEA